LTTESRSLTTSSYTLLMQAVKDQACDPAKLRELLAVRREWAADEAAKEFAAAITQFQSKCKVVAKTDIADGKPYAKMDRIWREVRPLMTECGLSVTWTSTTIEAGDICHLRGQLRHVAGHVEPLEYMLPIPKAITRRDGVAVQNAAQVMGAATTYAKRYATCSALGVQTGEDTDGNVREASPATADKLAVARELIAKTQSDEGKLCQYLNVHCLEDCTAEQIAQAIGLLKKKSRAGGAA